MKTHEWMKPALLAGLLFAFVLLVAVPVLAQDGSQGASAVPTVGCTPGGGAGLDAYAQREAASPDLAAFTGGHDDVIILGCSCAVVIIVVLIIV